MTYEDFLRQAQGSGLLEQFSQYDLDTARRYPEFGATMLSYKQDYASTTDAAARQRINQQAEALRKQYGSYMGGSDGSRYYGLGPSPGSYQNPYQSEISKLLQGMSGYGDFTYGEAPTYENRYQQELDSLLGQVQNYGPFEWSKEDDPSWSAYAKQYRREGERASANALAQAAAASGGQISTAAMTAAGQAGDYYASQLSDKIPELYQNAYNRYLSEYSMLLDQLNATRQAEQYDYQAYLDQLGQYNTDRELSYDQWLQGYNMLGSTLGAYQGQDETEYQRLLDQVGYNSDQQALAMDQVDAILAAGGMPSQELITASGYDSGYISAMEQAYRQMAVSGDGGYKPRLTLQQALDQIEAGNLAPEVLRTWEYYMGAQYDDPNDMGLEDVIGVMGLGMGSLSFEQVEKMADEGVLKLTETNDGKVRVTWAPGWNAEKYRNKNLETPWHKKAREGLQ